VRLARYAGAAGTQDAIDVGDRLVPLAGLGTDARTIVDVLALEAAERDRVAGRAAEVASSGGGDLLEGARLLAPIARPPKFLAMAFNADHDPAELLEKPDLPEAFRQRLHVVVATNRAYPASDVPVVFNKQTSSITGPDGDVWAPADAQHLDYEGELVVVIARRARRLDVREAAGVIGGYTAGNDVSIREWQFDTPTLWMGKSLETFGPIGPVVVTPDEIDGDDVAIRTWVNDDLRQDGSTAERRFKVAEIVAWISQRCTLEPGDLIATGTGGGLGQFTGRYMKPGDVVTVEVEGIGRLENHIVPEPVTAA
jgi:2-keto-4-pentenoate hydratase/2-oxohepta-3-ene-1,7-dioic acid hydratase in catechol pathway